MKDKRIHHREGEYEPATACGRRVIGYPSVLKSRWAYDAARVTCGACRRVIAYRNLASTAEAVRRARVEMAALAASTAEVTA